MVAKRRRPCYNRGVIDIAPSADWTIPQDWAHYSATDHRVWDHLFDRQTLQEVGAFGRIGRYAGQFVFLHNVAVDSRGNLYTSEVGGGRRVQKFVRR